MGLLDIFKKKCPKCKSTNIESTGETVEGDSIPHILTNHTKNSRQIC